MVPCRFAESMELEVCRPCAPTKDGVVVGSTPGVHILDARRPGCGCGWALAVEPFDREDFGLDDDDPVPDLSLDPEDMVLTVINATQGARAYHVSIADRDVLGQLGAEGDPIARLETAAEAPGGPRRTCATFSLALGAMTRVDVCVVDAEDVAAVDVASDIVDVVAPGSGVAPSDAYAFPLPAAGGPYLCTQGAGGLLSHYAHASTFHAVDFRCAEGTDVLAIGPGVVRAVSCDETAGSVHVSALFAWNAVTLALDDGALVEYVHVARGSSVVAVGDRVASGDKLCESGAAGFCPEPHLHLEMHLDDAKDAPSVPFRLRRRGGAPARPRAGEWWEPAA